MTVINDPRQPTDREGTRLGIQAPLRLHTASSGPHRPAQPPQPPQPAQPGHLAATQLLGLREVVLPAAVLVAADALLEHALASEDAVTRTAAAATRTRLRAALDAV
ncbi:MULTISPECIES: hypothetical protein [Kitasatospora]|uniref:Uncharacterized protein n=2 Tax=Kitasatospora TaxID=2063 RepID=A0ABT1J9V6_9ACTN|nr:hypothetical protein [Kitasatospora paracochleata]MCP2313843.1 hypothetical protein [Kitasatospora paracochleata]